MAAAYGTAPRKIGGVWYTRTGRRLSDAGQRYWENKRQQGFVNERGFTNPAAVEAVPHPKGLLAKGNIDIHNRPHVRNHDGSVSTVRSIGITDDRGRNIVIPTVVGNRVVSDNQAVAHYKKTGQHLGVFKTQAQADRYAQQLHEQQAAAGLNKSARTSSAVQRTSGSVSKPKVQGGATFTTPQQILEYRRTGKLPAYGPTAAQKRQQRMYEQQQQGHAETKAAAEAITTAKLPGSYRRSEQKAYKNVRPGAAKVLETAGNTLVALSPSTAAVEAVKAVRKHKVVQAGIAAASIVPVGGGGFRVVKAGEKAAEGVRALTRAEAVAKLNELEVRHEKFIDAAVKARKAGGKFSQEERTSTNVARGQYAKGKRLSQPPKLEDQFRQDTIDALDRMAHPGYVKQRDTIESLRKAIAETDPLVGERKPVPGEFGTVKVAEPGKPTVTTKKPAPSTKTARIVSTRVPPTVEKLTPTQLAKQALVKPEKLIRPSVSTRPGAVEKLTSGQLGKQRMVPQTAMFPKMGVSQEVMPKPSEATAAAYGSFLGPNAESMYEAKVAARRAQFGQRSAKGDVLSQQAGGGMAGHIARKQALKGQYAATPYKDLANITDEHMDTIAREIQGTRLLPQEKSNLIDAVQKAREGRVPSPYDRGLMEKAFGPYSPEAQDFANNGKKGLLQHVVDVVNVPRALMATGDFSYRMRNGLYYLAMHPQQALRNTGRSIVHHTFSQARYEADMQALHADPELAYAFKKRFLDSTDIGHLGPGPGREESFQSPLAETLTGPGVLFGKGKGSLSPVRAAGRQFTGNAMLDRASAYLGILEAAQKPQRSLRALGRRTKPGYALDDKLRKDAGMLANWATGRLPWGNETAEMLTNTFLFAPKLFKTRLQAINILPGKHGFYFNPDIHPFVRKEAAKSVVRLIAAGVGTLALAAKYGLDVELDPRSSDFGKIRHGKTRFDIWGGNQQVVRAIAQIGSQSSKSSTTGEIKHFGDLRHGRPSLKPAGRFLEGKLSPPFSFGLDYYRQEMFGGKPFSWSAEAIQHLSPLLYQDIWDAWHKQSPALAGVGGVASTFGVGMQTYSSQKPDRHNIRHPGTGRFSKQNGLPTPAEIARELGHGSGLPTPAEIAKELGH